MSPLQTCDDLRPLLGGYVLEALEPDEMEAVREHLPGCPACSAEHASLAGLPALLDLAAPLDAPDEPLSPAFEEALLDRFARDRETPAAASAPKRRRRLPRIAWTRPRVAVASALAAAAITFATMTALDDDPPPQPTASRNYVVRLKPGAAAPAGSRVSGRVALYRVRGGTGVHLWASGLRSGRKHVYEVLCEKGGWSASAGTFRADARGRVEAKLTTAARVGEYDSLRIVYRDERGHIKDVLTGRLF
jgi:putative zinc finger protein